jgi:hypothetical protein
MQQVMKEIRFYFSVIVIPFGIALNSISFIIFIRKRLNHKSIFGYLYAWQCIFDIISLLNEVIFAIFEYKDIEVIAHSQLTCKTLYGWIKYITHLPSFQMILIALYFYISIAYNKQRILFHKYKLYIVFFMILIVTLVNCIFIIYEKKVMEVFEIRYFNETTNQTLIEYETKYECKTEFILDFSLDWINLAMRDFIPFIMIFLLNFLAIRFLFKSKTSVNSKIRKKEFSFVLSIFVANFIFLAIYLPWSIVFVIYHVNHSFYIFPDLIHSSLFEITATLFGSLAYLNNMMCFFTNIKFNYLFYEEFFQLLGIKKRVFPASQRQNSASVIVTET